MTKQINLTIENAREMYNSGVESLKTLALNNYSLGELKPKPEWKNLGEIDGYFVDTNCGIHRFCSLVSKPTHKNIFPTKEEAEACLALSQLCQWRDKYNEGWKPDWNDKNNKKWTIIIFSNDIIAHSYFDTHSVLSFKSAEIRDKFLEDFYELIEIAKPLL